MAFITYLLCTVFIQLLTTRQISALYGQGATNLQNSQFGNTLSNARSLASNIAFAKGPGATPSPNIARNVAITENGLAKANRNSANSIVATENIPILNTNPNIRTANTVNQNLASNLASANAAAVSFDVNNIAKNAASSANSGIPSNLFSIANPSLPGNIGSSIGTSQLSQYRLSNSYNSPAQMYNPSTKSNIANNLANGNIANINRASLPNWYPNAGTGNSYSQSLYKPPANQQYGITVQADALEIAGNVAVTGNMPFYGTVTLNGRLPTEGVATVNYACSG